MCVFAAFSSTIQADSRKSGEHEFPGFFIYYHRYPELSGNGLRRSFFSLNKFFDKTCPYLAKHPVIIPSGVFQQQYPFIFMIMENDEILPRKETKEIFCLFLRLGGQGDMRVV